MGVRMEETGICSPGHWSKNQKFLENLRLAAQFRLIHLIVAMTVYMPVWHWHCTRPRFTVLVSCNDEIAVGTCPLLCLQKQVVKLASGLVYWWSLSRNNNTAINLPTFTANYGSRGLSACDQGSHCRVFPPRSGIFCRPGCLGLIMKNRVKSVF